MYAEERDYRTGNLYPYSIINNNVGTLLFGSRVYAEERDYRTGNLYPYLIINSKLIKTVVCHLLYIAYAIISQNSIFTIDVDVEVQFFLNLYQ